MKRTLEFMVLGIIGVLLSAASAFSPVPIAEPDASGMQQPHSIPAAAADKPGEGPAITAVSSSGLSRIDHPSLDGIVAEAPNPAVLDQHRIAFANFSADSVHEIGFDSFRRAPPSPAQD
jgi:hypothetical protein